MSLLRVDGVRMVFDGASGRSHVLEDVSLSIGNRDFVAIVGASGCGKTTLLRIMAGLQPPTGGTVSLEGAPVTAPDPRICLVFQHYASTLLPWKRVDDNVLLGLRAGDGPPAQLRAAAHALLERMGLAGAARSYPWELSGGMQQRVALARALIRKPRVLLLDEPFAAVDERTRVGLQELLRDLRAAAPCSVVLVTHHLDDVIALARRVLVLAGRPARMTAVIEDPNLLTQERLRSHLAAVTPVERA